MTCLVQNNYDIVYSTKKHYSICKLCGVQLHMVQTPGNLKNIYQNHETHNA